MKVLAWIFGLVVLAVVGAGVYVFLNSGSLLKDAIEEFAPEYLGAPVKVGAVNLSLADGAAQIKSLEVGNPQGFEGSHAIKLGKISAVIDTQNSTEKLVVLKRILIDGADIAAIAKGQKTNFQQLIDNLDSASGGTGSSSSGESADDMKFIVDRLDFTNTKASLSSDLLGDVAMDIPDIHLKDIGRKSDGATGAELAEQILKPISKAVSREAVNQGLDIEGVKGRVQDKIREKLGSGLRGLTDRLKK